MDRSRNFDETRENWAHVIVRAVGGEKLLAPTEKGIARGLVTQTSGFSKIQVIAGCLMDNHVHLILYIPVRMPVTVFHQFLWKFSQGRKK